jgi:hypothetical protein
MYNLYTLSLGNTFLSHDILPALAVQEVTDEHSQAEVDALVASGDYFETLATKLDDISIMLARRGAPEHIDLQHIVDTLLYMQKHYTVQKNS